MTAPSSIGMRLMDNDDACTSVFFFQTKSDFSQGVFLVNVSYRFSTQTRHWLHYFTAILLQWPRAIFSVSIDANQVQCPKIKLACSNPVSKGRNSYLVQMSILSLQLLLMLLLL